MNEKLNMQDLIDLLTYKYNIPKKNVELFVKEFFDLVVYALENDKYLKIKGFGTFKLIDVDSRESINVNTGERFIIEGHSKISFTPDVSLKNSINKPFAHFETAILNDNIQFDNVENADISEEVVSLHDDSDTVFPSNEPIEEFTNKILLVKRMEDFC
jgi:nucleoid DNA-binding protein